jgi:hypothetical protein
VLPRNLRQEALSRAYARAVAAQAGVAVCEPECDFGIDMTLRSLVVRDGRRRDVGPHIDLQLKSTTRANLVDTHLNYDLPVLNYDDLREADPPTSRLLVVLLLPDDESQWLSQSPEELTLRHCAYWMSLVGLPPTASRSTVRVSIPLANIFSPEAVRDMMQQMTERRER